MNKPSLPRRFFTAFWHVLTRVRQALSNILFLLALVLIYFLYRGAAPQPLPEQAALLLNPAGVVVDETSPVEPLQALGGGPEPEDREVPLLGAITRIVGESPSGAHGRVGGRSAANDSQMRGFRRSA